MMPEMQLCNFAKIEKTNVLKIILFTMECAENIMHIFLDRIKE
jgi:hypothetical protein